MSAELLSPHPAVSVMLLKNMLRNNLELVNAMAEIGQFGMARTSLAEAARQLDLLERVPRSGGNPSGKNALAAIDV